MLAGARARKISSANLVPEIELKVSNFACGVSRFHGGCIHLRDSVAAHAHATSVHVRMLDGAEEMPGRGDVRGLRSH